MLSATSRPKSSTVTSSSKSVASRGKKWLKMKSETDSVTSAETHTHTRYQKGKTNLDFTEARDSEWQWHQLEHMQVCTSLQTDNHTSTPPLCFFTGRMPFLLPNQQHQSTEGKSETDSVMSAENRKGKNVCRYLNARERFLISAVESYCNSERLRQFRQ